LHRVTEARDTVTPDALFRWLHAANAQRDAPCVSVKGRRTAALGSQILAGIIGGSGLYDIDGLSDAQWQTVESPWGTPSDDILCGTLNGTEMAFLPRHGRGHVHSPSTVPYRANIDARHGAR